MVNLKLFIGSIIISLMIGFGFGKYFLAPKTVVKTEVQTVTKEVVKKDVTTITDIKENKDGSKETVITEVDKSQINKDSASMSKSEIKVDAKTNYRIDFTASKSPFNMDPITYGVIVSGRILGPITLGIGLNTDKYITVDVGFEF